MRFLNFILFLSCFALVSYSYRFTWPTYTAKVIYVSNTIKVASKETYDGLGKPYAATSALGDGGQGENQLPIFEVENDGTLQNVIIDIDGADGIHCMGSCTLKNVWWLKSGEDCATLKASKSNSNPTMHIIGGGVRDAKDKVFQHNGPGTISISGGFQAENFGKLYRSCGNCKTQYHRNVIIDGIKVANPDKAIVAINGRYSNVNYVDQSGDNASIRNVIAFDTKPDQVCEKFTANDKSEEPGDPYASGSDGKNCIYSTSDVIFSENS